MRQGADEELAKAWAHGLIGRRESHSYRSCVPKCRTPTGATVSSIYRDRTAVKSHDPCYTLAPVPLLRAPDSRQKSGHGFKSAPNRKRPGLPGLFLRMVAGTRLLLSAGIPFALVTA